MKTLEFKTSKGEFILVDGKINLETFNCESKLEFVSKLKDITESKSSNIVDILMSGTVLGKLLTGMDNHRIDIYQHEGSNVKFMTSIKCLHSIIESKAVYLYRNPFKIGTSKEDYKLFKQAEEKTFYNPYLFKKK